MAEEETQTLPSPTGQISINIANEAITWETNFSLPETVLWLEVLRTMLVTKVIRGDNES